MIWFSEQKVDFVDTALGRAILRALQRKKAAELLKGKGPKAVKKVEPKEVPRPKAVVAKPPKVEPGKAPTGPPMGKGPTGPPMGKGPSLGPSLGKGPPLSLPPLAKAGGGLPSLPAKGPAGAGMKPKVPGPETVKRGMGPGQPPGSSLRLPALKQFSSLDWVGDRLDELGLLEPSEVGGQSSGEDGSAYDALDQLVLRVNALQALGYLDDVYVEPELGAVILIFDREMDLDLAVKLLVGLRELMPGTQVVQRPSEQDKSLKWVYLCTKEPVEIPEIEKSRTVGKV